MARALGTDDSVTTCDCCGKVNLKFTVTIELDDGEIVHYGQICASRNTGKTRPQIGAEIKAHEVAKRAAARAEFYSCPAYLAERARFDERNQLPRMLGLQAAEFVSAASAAADAACKEIAARHGVDYWNVRA